MPLLDRRLREIERLYRARYTAFVRVAFGITGNADLAAEAVQQAFADAIRSRSTFVATVRSRHGSGVPFSTLPGKRRRDGRG